MYDTTLGTNAITTPNEECLNRRRCEGRLLVRIESTVRETVTLVSYGKFTHKHYVDGFGPVGINLKAQT